MLKTFRIVSAPPCVAQLQYALDSLIGLEFKDNPERVEAIRRQYLYLPPAPPHWLVAVDVQVILRKLQYLERPMAVLYWTSFAAICPLVYIPIDCCETIDDEYLQGV